MPENTPTVATKESQTSAYTQAYNMLNTEQRQAVDTIEGPVMVVAGPGSGKTQVIALRVATILRKTQMRPGNILCLTFSVNGATAMRERLRKLIGADAYGVTVKNFHSFCNDIIQEHPLIFENWSALEQISDVEKYRELNKIIDQLLPNCVLVSRKNPYSRSREILGRISDLKREGVTDKAHLQSIVEEYENQMASKSKEGTKQHEKNVLAAQKFREFIEVFHRYQEMLIDTGRYDYDDMILYVIDALKEQDYLLQSLQEKYQYILVDEFQDTNGAQYSLVELITSYASVDHSPNLFVVGDDDQAIYRFQGANLSNILSFHDRFPRAPIISLATSYRSTQPILDAASHLIEHNTERLVGRIEGLEKHLVAHANPEGPEPILYISPSDATENYLIADIIDGQLQQGVPPEDIAVLVQKNSELIGLYDVLSARKIPVQMSGKVDLLSQPLVRQCLSILRAVERPNESHALAQALGCPCFVLSPADLGRIFTYRKEHNITVLAALMELDIEDSAIQSLPLMGKASLIDVRNTILQLHNELGSSTIVQTAEHLLKRTGLLRMAKGDGNPATFDALAFASLQEFFERIKYRAYEQPHYSIHQLLEDIEYYENPEYGDLKLTYDIPHLTEAGVHIMTAHKSKGLEFHTVILANFRHGHWDNKRGGFGLSVPEDLLFGWEKDQKHYEKTQDERRVAYVAITRAKRELILTCPKQLSSGDSLRDVSPSAFFAEAKTISETERELRNPQEAATLLFDPIIISDEAYKAFLRERLENYHLSVTALNHFLEDPQLFLDRHILQIPQAKEASLVYGNAVHEAVKLWAQALQRGEEFSEQNFMRAFTAYLDNRELLTNSERALLLAEGQADLPRYFQTRLQSAHPYIYKTEYTIIAHMDDIPLKGTLDRIDLQSPTSSSATVVDYKTGAPQTEKQIRDGGYYRQLVFYALLLDNQKKLPIQAEAFVLDFIGRGTDYPVERIFSVTEQDKQELAELITHVWDKIISLDFTAI